MCLEALDGNLDYPKMFQFTLEVFTGLNVRVFPSFESCEPRSSAAHESPFVSSGMAARKVGWSQETNTSVPLVANCALTNIGGYRRRITRGAVLHSVVYLNKHGERASEQNILNYTEQYLKQS